MACFRPVLLVLYSFSFTLVGPAAAAPIAAAITSATAKAGGRKVSFVEFSSVGDQPYSSPRPAPKVIRLRAAAGGPPTARGRPAPRRPPAEPPPGRNALHFG